MEASQEWIRTGMVRRTVAFGLAVLATSFLFISVPMVLTAGANGVAAAQVVHVAAATAPAA